MNMDVMKKSVEKITLKEEMSLDQLYDLMKENQEELPAKFKLKKGLMGKSINFDVFMQTEPRITVKDKVVTIRRMGSSTKVGIGSMPSLDYKDMKQRVKAVKDGGIKKSVTGGAEYFVGVCNAMVELLGPFAA